MGRVTRGILPLPVKHIVYFTYTDVFYWADRIAR